MFYKSLIPAIAVAGFIGLLAINTDAAAATYSDADISFVDSAKTEQRIETSTGTIIVTEFVSEMSRIN